MMGFGEAPRAPTRVLPESPNVSKIDNRWVRRLRSRTQRADHSVHGLVGLRQRPARHVAPSAQVISVLGGTEKGIGYEPRIADNRH